MQPDVLQRRVRDDQLAGVQRSVHVQPADRIDGDSDEPRRGRPAALRSPVLSCCLLAGRLRRSGRHVPIQVDFVHVQIELHGGVFDGSGNLEFTGQLAVVQAERQIVQVQAACGPVEPAGQGHLGQRLRAGGRRQLHFELSRERAQIEGPDVEPSAEGRCARRTGQADVAGHFQAEAAQDEPIEGQGPLVQVDSGIGDVEGHLRRRIGYAFPGERRLQGQRRQDDAGAGSLHPGFELQRLQDPRQAGLTEGHEQPGHFGAPDLQVPAHRSLAGPHVPCIQRTGRVDPQGVDRQRRDGYVAVLQVGVEVRLHVERLDRTAGQLLSILRQNRIPAPLQLPGHLHQDRQVRSSRIQPAPVSRRAGKDAAGLDLAGDGGAEQGRGQPGEAHVAVFEVRVHRRAGLEAPVFQSGKPGRQRLDLGHLEQQRQIRTFHVHRRADRRRGRFDPARVETAFDRRFQGVDPEVGNRCRSGVQIDADAGGQRRRRFSAGDVPASDQRAGVQWRNSVLPFAGIVGNDAGHVDRRIDRRFVARCVEAQDQIDRLPVLERGRRCVQIGDVVADRGLPVVPGDAGVFHGDAAEDDRGQRQGRYAGFRRISGLRLIPDLRFIPSHEVVPVRNTLLVSGEVDDRAPDVHRVHLVPQAQKGQQLHPHPGVVHAQERRIAEARRIAQADSVHFQPQPGIQGDGDVAVEGEGPAGPFVELGRYPVLVVVGIDRYGGDDPRRHDDDGEHERPEQQLCQ